jgi:hypothetical protein
VVAGQTCTSDGTTYDYSGSLTTSGNAVSGSLSLASSGTDALSGTLTYSCTKDGAAGAPYAH